MTAAPLTRRATLAGGLALLSAPMLIRPLAAAQTARREFRVLRGDSDIGSQSVEVARDGARAEVRVRSRLEVKLLMITAYRYELDSTEVWEGGALVSLDSTVNDDGTRETARVRRENGRLVSTGTWQGDIEGEPATTSYWSPEFLTRSTWISTQTGKPLAVRTRRDGTETVPAPGGARDCARWQVTGDLPLTLYYDQRDEWMGSAFDARGERARFRAVSETARLTPLWPARA